MMLSHAAHQYVPNPHFQPLPSSNGGMASDPLMPYHLQHHQQHQQQQQHMSMPQPTPSLKSDKIPRYHHPYDIHHDADTRGRISRERHQSTGPIRRRISRACDQCNQLRTKCDGKLPCQHCFDFSLKCEYARERKKRGKASRKDIQQQQAAAAAAAMQNGLADGESSADTIRSMSGSSRRESDLLPPPRPITIKKESPSTNSSRESLGDIHDLSHHHHQNAHHHHHHQQQQQQMHHLPQHPQQHHHHMSRPESPSIHIGHDGITAGIPIRYDRMSPFPQQSPGSQTASTVPNNYSQGDFVMSPPHHQAPPPMAFPTNGASPMAGMLSGHSPESPTWISLPSPPPQTFNAGIRYPVLLPLLPYISLIIPSNLACDLLDLYFTNPSTSFFQPASPYVLTHIFRKRSFLHPTNPRPTSPALLCAMLWAASQTCDVPFLTATSTSRGRVCQKLLELCISLLRPLVHVGLSSGHHQGTVSDAEIGNASIGFSGIAGSPREGVGAAGTLDDVLTYAHLGIVISASDFKAASLRWWNVAWTLAREIKLNREVTQESMEDDMDAHHSPCDSGPDSAYSCAAGISEEEREERRRTWWLLYIVDRHLALCYNRPLALLDVECEGLFVPLDDVAWQCGDFYGSNESNMYSHSPISPTSTPPSRTLWPVLEITGPGIYQFFLPLMVILGQIVDLHHTRNRPRFGSGKHLNADHGFEQTVNNINAQLDMYARSLQDFEATRTTNDQSDRSISESEIQARIAISYGTHIMHVLRILASGKWDPISMLDDNDFWMSSNSFISSTTHAVSAAEAIVNILKYDPQLTFMPYFFGIYLLQGSFLLLLIADKMQHEASDAVFRACETTVRAHEICIVTLNTGYQRDFRKVMKSTIDQLRGGDVPDDSDDQKFKRREVLQLYRWCGGGTGLAL